MKIFLNKNLESNKKYFTIVQYAGGPLVDLENTLIFSMGGAFDTNIPKTSQLGGASQADWHITPQRSTQSPVTDPRAEEWAANNAWFGNDSAMTYTAFDIHKKLVEEEGFDPKSDEYYAEIDKRIRLEFPHKFDKPVERTTSKPTQTVASATRSPKTSRKSVKLTPSQVAIAKKLGVPLEEYAKQLKITKEA